MISLPSADLAFADLIGGVLGLRCKNFSRTWGPGIILNAPPHGFIICTVRRACTEAGELTIANIVAIIKDYRQTTQLKKSLMASTR